MPPMNAPAGDADLARECEAILTGSRSFDITIGRYTLRARTPHPAAIHVVNTALSAKIPRARQNDMVSKFVHDHLEPGSIEHLHEMAMDPDTDLPRDVYYSVFRKILTSGTARPSGPLR